MTNGQRHHAALPRGYRLHWYEIESILGQGGFGITYLATDTNLDTKVAIKEFLPTDLAVRTHDSSVQPMSDRHRDTFAWGLSRFVAEAKTLAKVRHPNIVLVYNVFEANNTAYMVMDFVEGQTLEDALKYRRVHTEQQLLDIAFPLLDALERLHANGFIHRDIKPQNIYLRADGTPLLLDFGSARQAIGAKTRTLTALVSPGYAPFEQYGAASKDTDRQGPWTDIYALGATLYRAVTGKPPVDAMVRVNSVVGGGRDVVIPAAAVGEGLYSAKFLRAIDAALEFLPEKRPQSVAEWRATLPAVAEGAERPESAIETVPGPGTPPRGRDAPPGRAGTPRWVAALVLIGLGVSGYYALWPRLEPLLFGESREEAKAARAAAERQAELTRESARLIALREQMEAERKKFTELQAELDAARGRQAAEAEKLAETQRRAEQEAARVAALEEQSEEERAANERRSEEEAERLAEIRREMEAERERLAALQGQLDEATKGQVTELRKLEEAQRQVEAERNKVAEESAKVTQLTELGRAELERQAEAEAKRKAEEERLATREVELAELERRVAAEQARLAELGRERQAAEAERRKLEEAEQRRLAEERQKAEEEARREAETKRLAEEAGKREREEKIAALLAAAEEHVAALRLTTPEGNNALEALRAVLALEPENAAAKQGVLGIAGKYVELSEKAAARGALDSAERHLAKAEELAPGAETVAFAREALEEMKAKAGSEAAEAKRKPEEVKELTEAPAKVEQERQEGTQLAEAQEEKSSAGIEPDMVRISGGCFEMGSPTHEKGRDNAERQHRVCVKDFAIGKHEVTFEQYDKFVRATGRAMPNDRGWGRGNRPVIYVDWHDVVAYADWLSRETGKRYRLPTEAEWEYAARAGSQTAYPWGDDIGRNRANCYACGTRWDNNQTAPVGSFAPNAWGIHDTAGNVWEWTCSGYDYAYGGGELQCAASPSVPRSIRGGDWNDGPGYVRSASRYVRTPGNRQNNLGFRLAQD